MRRFFFVLIAACAFAFTGASAAGGLINQDVKFDVESDVLIAPMKFRHFTSQGVTREKVVVSQISTTFEGNNGQCFKSTKVRDTEFGTYKHSLETIKCP